MIVRALNRHDPICTFPSCMAFVSAWPFGMGCRFVVFMLNFFFSDFFLSEFDRMIDIKISWFLFGFVDSGIAQKTIPPCLRISLQSPLTTAR